MMSKGFWKNLPAPFFVLAPMADVTDAAFRQIIAKYGKPDVTWTEFVSCDGLCSAGREHLLSLLRYTEAERPIVAQLFGAKPENFYESARLLVQLGFDGIDINMGCPDKKVEKQGAGAKLIQNHELARAIIRATKSGAGDVPVSVKTRIGYRIDELNTWLPALLAEEPAVITIHARTRSELSLVPACWQAIKRAVDIARSSHTFIIGNGDVRDIDDARQRAEEAGVNGVMLGRAVFGNPWLFNRTKTIEKISIEERLNVMVEHMILYEKIFGQTKSFAIMKKHFSAYANGFPGARTLRMRLMETQNAIQVAEVVSQFSKNL